MAFGGAPVVTQISDRVCRITGATLAAAATGVISAAGGAGDVTLPASFTPNINPSALGAISDRFVVSIQQVGGAATGMPYHVVKAGATAAAFTCSITNDGAAGSGTLEIFCELLG